MRREARDAPEIDMAAEVCAAVPVARAIEPRGSGVVSRLHRGRKVVPREAGLLQCDSLVERGRVRVHARHARDAVGLDAAQVRPEAARQGPGGVAYIGRTTVVVPHERLIDDARTG